MGVPSFQPVHARDRDGPGGLDDPRRTRAQAGARRRRGLAAGLIAVFLIAATAAGAKDSLRIASYNTELSRPGPGLLLRDILSGEDEQVNAVVAVIASAAADVIVLQGFDYDYGGQALAALADWLTVAGTAYPYRFAPRPNSGMATGFDLDGNGRLGEPRDAQGYGRFAGQGGMAVLSRLPIPVDEARDFSAFLWRDLPGAMLPQVDGAPFPSVEAQAVQRLSSVGHWDVPVTLPDGTRLHLLTFHATTPVFDGPEDRNGRRNADEIRFWQLLMDGALPFAAPERPVVVVGDANLDPVDGDGRHEAIRALLADPRLHDPRPVSAGGTAAANSGQHGDPALDTADWVDPVPGNLRVDYVVPDATIHVTGTGVIWPAPDDPLAGTVATASRHRLVWVDIALD